MLKLCNPQGLIGHPLPTLAQWPLSIYASLNTAVYCSDDAMSTPAFVNNTSSRTIPLFERIDSNIVSKSKKPKSQVSATLPITNLHPSPEDLWVRLRHYQQQAQLSLGSGESASRS